MSKKIKHLSIISFMILVYLLIISINNKVYAKIPASQISLSLSQITYNYDGKSHKPTVYAYYNGAALTRGTSFTVTYPSDTANAGWHTITVDFKGNYSGRKTVQYRIIGIQVNEVSVSLSRYTPYTYDGNVHRPKVYVYCRGGQLTEGVSYTLSCSNGIYAGTHSITVNLKGNYEGWIRKTYTINKADIAYADIRFLESAIFTYTGGVQYPEYRVIYGSRTLGNRDFTFSFPRNNVTAGEKIIRISGCGNYCGYKDTYYTIKKRSISGGSINLNTTRFTYTGGQIKPSISSVKMSNGRTQVYDYSVKYEKNVYAGTGKIIVTGINNNTGSITKTFTINKRSIAGGDVYLDKNSYTYTGGQIKPKVTAVYMPNHTTRVYDYKVEYGTNIYPGNVNWVKITGTNNNTGTIYKYFTIKKRSISGGRIELKNHILNKLHQQKMI